MESDLQQVKYGGGGVALFLCLELISTVQSNFFERILVVLNIEYFRHPVAKKYNSQLEIEMKSNTIRLAVVGDQGVGKTSLVCAIISDLPSEPPKIHKKVVLPPDMCAYSKDIFTEIVDTGPDPRQQIKICDLVILVYDVSNPESVMRLKEHWLPIINTLTKDVNKQTPVVIVGNKSDKVELPIDQEQDYQPVKQVLKGLVRTYKQVQMGIECSARYDKNVMKALKSAQRAVLYPLSPLYDLTLKTISPKFKKALLRIFRILDTDLSGTLSDRDLSSLQERVFQTELSGEDIRAIKNIIQKQCEEEQDHAITVKGFIAFQKKCIEMLKIQICWNILKYFDYNHELEINNNRDSFAIKYEEGESLELSLDAQEFLQRIFTFALKTASEGEDPMEKLFEPAPEIPLPQFKNKNLTLERFIYLWHLFTVLDYRQCYRALLYIGYDKKLDQCFTITNNKKRYSDLTKIKDRSMYNILFISNEEYSYCLNPIFTDGVEEGGIYRNVVLHSGEKYSKIVNLFMVKERLFKSFMAENSLAQKIDLVIFFPSERIRGSDIQEAIPAHIMRKEVTKQIAENELKLNEMPSLNLKTFPIQLREVPQQKLVAYLVTIFQKIEEGYPQDYLTALKKEETKVRNIFLGVMSGVALFTVGFLTFQHQKHK